MATDVPSPEEVHQRLVDRYTEIAKLAGGLAHEVKNPLSTIRLNLELLAEDFARSEELRDRRALAKIETVQRECQRLEDLLNDFLNFAKVRHARLEPCHLNDEVRRLVDFFRPQAAAAGVEVIAYLQFDLPRVMLDRESFRAALLNLFLNAVQAMPQGGQLVVATEPTPRGVALHVIDTGVGMDAATRDRVFEAFFSTKSGGSGLGLPTARKIIEAHGGAITCMSEPGRGTRFTILLPVVKRLEGQETDHQEPGATGSSIDTAPAAGPQASAMSTAADPATGLQRDPP